MPDDLRPAPPSTNVDPERTYLGAQRALPSALAVVAADTIHEHSTPSGKDSAKLRWLDRHRAAVIGATVAALSLAVVAVTAILLARKTLPASSAQALAGLARQQVAEGDYDIAISNYLKLREGTRGAAAVELLMGNTYFGKRDFAAAETCYRNVIQQDPGSATALYNLGLALFKQDRLNEAAACYEELLRKHGALHPGLANRARLALELIAERSGPSS